MPRLIAIFHDLRAIRGYQTHHCFAMDGQFRNIPILNQTESRAVLGVAYRLECSFPREAWRMTQDYDYEKGQSNSCPRRATNVLVRACRSDPPLERKRPVGILEAAGGFIGGATQANAFGSTVTATTSIGANIFRNPPE
ncbi:MAG: hypothetical protein KDA55_23620 [Planctomycetales bacterium]|nr:hypothetical protein [Planctomycetales bacterium]